MVYYGCKEGSVTPRFSLNMSEYSRLTNQKIPKMIYQQFVSVIILTSIHLNVNLFIKIFVSIMDQFEW